ncbi:ESPR-type extended signal peptide-containing protein [Stenotrophomonas sp. 24(2023)]|uniref:ESPR-type extended signal peptide-containing protein n=1 Tax=Stenotrophomonas sp. 24(2023) TaxID=3068324 RepID=UPI0027E17899|nr:ESPR-type extended signal peptide-containing protein [Stenotrophomonas sp. 24(2023)]WMJ70351.1 ESPR-type extended signal peptide-containing protein [Stenotrophomonas sp. 24(2023)]
MNKIYRRLWSRARGCWIVASEFGRDRCGPVTGRKAGRPAATGLMLAIALALPAVASADASDERWDDEEVATWPLYPLQVLHALALPAAAPVATISSLHHQNALTVDTTYQNSTVSGNKSMILGSRSSINGYRSNVYGTESHTRGDDHVAVGYGINMNGSQGTAVGTRAATNGVGATALGHDAYANGMNTIAIGSGSRAQHVESIAIGANSVTNGANQVSVGSSSRKRRIVNVADATLSTTSSDAVTGKQLHATNQSVATATSTANTARSIADQALQSARLVTQTSTSSAIRVGSDNTGTTLTISNRSGAARTLNGVRNGALNNSSTEAVAGQQLHATNQNVAAARSIADAVNSRLNAAAVALGQSATAEGSGTVASAAIGSAARAYNTHSVALGADARAAVDANGNKSSATGSVALGAGTRSGNGGVATGLRALATGDRAVALGNDAAAGFTHATAVGYKAAAGANQATAVGREAAASGTYASALGNLAKATADSAVAVGDRSIASHAGSIALGSGAQTSAANQVSVGSSTVKRRIVNLADGTLSSTSTDAVTGRQLHATGQVVDAHRQVLDAHGQQLAGLDQRVLHNRTGLEALRAAFDDFEPDLDGVLRFAADGGVEVGGGQLRGVAAGDISSAASTHAVTGGQLFATNERVGALEGFTRFFKIGVDEESLDARAGWAGIAIGESATATPGSDMEGGTAVGSFSRAMAFNSVALGRAAHVIESAAEGFALGASSIVHVPGGMALGGRAEIRPGATNGVALGYSSYTDQADTVSIGNGRLKRRIINVGNGRAADDAVTVAQLGGSLAGLGGGAAVDAAGNIIAPRYAIQGGLHTTVGDALRSLDGAVVAGSARVDRLEDSLRAVFQESLSPRADGASPLRLAGAQGRVVSNVANGVIAAGSRDAVNGGQLHAVQQQLNGRIDGLEQQAQAVPVARTAVAAVAPPAGSGTVAPVEGQGTPGQAAAGEVPVPAAPPVARADAADAPRPQVDTAELERLLARANDYTDGVSRAVDARLDKMDKRFNRMAAMSSAQSAMAMNTAGLATYNRLGAGVGYSDGESAMAVGYQRVLTQTGSATFSLNGAFTNSGERSVGVGVGIGW